MPLVAHSPQTAGEAVAYPARPREVRVCATPGCGTHLRRGHGPYCSLCERPEPLTATERQAEAQLAPRDKDSDPSASAAGEAGTKAAPAGRSTEEGKVATRGKTGEGKAAVLQCVVRQGKGTAKGVADELGLSRPTVAEHLRHLVEEGKLTKERVGMTHFFAPATVKDEAADCQADEAGHAAEDRRRELYVDEIMRDAVAKSADHDPAPTPLGAAADTSPPQPAGPAAPSPSTAAESPAAGTCDPEVDAISACVRALQPLGEIARRRVVCYLSSRESGAGQ